jgi:cell division ATPase FtsA
MKSINEIINDALSEIRKVHGIEIDSISSMVVHESFDCENIQRLINFQGEAKEISYED